MSNHKPLQMTVHSDFVLGGDMPIHRLGFGSVQLCRKDGWGIPKDRFQAVAVVQHSGECQN